VSAPKPVEEPVKPPPAPKEPEQVVTTTVAAPSRNEN
jgi:hypothetical protein